MKVLALLKSCVSSVIFISCSQSSGLQNHNSLISSYEYDVQNAETSCGTSQGCLKDRLRSIARSGKHSMTYRDARMKMYHYVDAVYENGEKVVYGVYSGERFVLTEGVMPDHHVVNCEHSWPVSYFRPMVGAGSASPKTDLFHLYPASNHVNSMRSNFPFKDLGGFAHNYIQVSGFAVEPPDSHKGKLARSMFYISVAYGLPIDDEQESAFKRWNKEFPVTHEEQERAFRVQEVQGNLNPFVFFPHLVENIHDF